MIIMINGPFGAGKTTTAQLLQAHIPNSMIFDPEEIGYMLKILITYLRDFKALIMMFITFV
jgi:deoxyadenosine/deoxycytidine kinase